MPTKRVREIKKAGSKSNPVENITAAGGVLFRQGSGKSDKEVLLIFRRGVWDLPKGKQEENESIEECAVREVAEEIGISNSPEIICPLIQTYHEYEQDGLFFGKTTHWFAMQLTSEAESFSPEEKEGIKKAEWYSVDEAKEKVGYNNLLDVLKALAEK